MTKEIRTGSTSAAPSAKRRWTQPRVESVEGREASATFTGSGGVDYGTYS
jgi:hypothetical protein